MNNNILLGKIGEQFAVQYLIAKGFRIVSLNYPTPFGEIDIIAQRKDWTVFIEVKCRTSERYGPPLSSITMEKKRHILRNCLFYVSRNKLHEKPWRIDAIGINLNTKCELLILKYVKNAVIEE